MNESAAFRYLLDLLDRLGIGYFVGGSLASSIHGTARATMDVDIVVAIQLSDVADLVKGLHGMFYADEDRIRRAIERGRGFHLIHIATAYKFDLFPMRDDAFWREEFERRQAITSAPFGGNASTFFVATPEDTLLAKLDWFRQGGRTSEKQWNDMLGIVITQGSRLDRTYLRRWATLLQVDDLLEKLLGQ